MTRKAKIGMLLVLGICVMFAMVLSELNTKPGKNTSALEQKTQSARYYSNAPVFREVENRVAPHSVSSIRPLPKHRMLVAREAAAPIQPVEPQAVKLAVENQRRIHVVQAGDTLTKIARKYYGSGNGMLYRLIIQANKDTLDNPDNLKIGTKLLIPVKPVE